MIYKCNYRLCTALCGRKGESSIRTATIENGHIDRDTEVADLIPLESIQPPYSLVLIFPGLEIRQNQHRVIKIDALCQKFVLTAAGRAYSRMPQWMRMLVTDGTLNVSGSTINTDAKGGAGVFAYKNGTVNISDTVIHTKQDTSGGIHAAGAAER